MERTDFNVLSLFHEENSEKEKQQARKYIANEAGHSPGEQKDKDKDACCGVFFSH